MKRGIRAMLICQNFCQAQNLNVEDGKAWFYYWSSRFKKEPENISTGSHFSVFVKKQISGDFWEYCRSPTATNVNFTGQVNPSQLRQRPRAICLGLQPNIQQTALFEAFDPASINIFPLSSTVEKPERNTYTRARHFPRNNTASLHAI